MVYIGFSVSTIFILIFLFLNIYSYYLASKNHLRKSELFYVISFFYSLLNMFLMNWSMLFFSKQPEISSEVVDGYLIILMILWILLSIIALRTESRITKWIHLLNDDAQKNKSLLGIFAGKVFYAFAIIIFLNLSIYSGIVSYVFY